MKLLQLLTASAPPSTRCDAACRDRGRREAIYDAAAQTAIRI
jgi:hypothetical protein